MALFRGRRQFRSESAAFLKDMAVLTVKPQQPDGEGRLQPVHPRDHVWLRRLKRQMEVISHDNVRVHSPTEFLARFARDAGKRTAGSGRCENVVP
jgi:hypothetical protein